MWKQREVTYMRTLSRFVAELTFLAGGRSSLPKLDGYMPHLVLDGGSDYLGVRFVEGPQPIFDTPIVSEFELMYQGVDYAPLIPGVSFTVREGARIVARGRVLRIV